MRTSAQLSSAQLRSPSLPPSYLPSFFPSLLRFHLSMETVGRTIPKRNIWKPATVSSSRGNSNKQSGQGMSTDTCREEELRWPGVITTFDGKCASSGLLQVITVEKKTRETVLTAQSAADRRRIEFAGMLASIAWKSSN